VRSLDVDLCSMPGDAMDFFHRSGHRLNVLNDVNHPDTVKAVIWKWVGKLIQVMDNIDSFQRHNVQSDASRPFVFAAANIENLKTQSQFPPVASKARTGAALYRNHVSMQTDARTVIPAKREREPGSSLDFRVRGNGEPTLHGSRLRGPL
jgi:hypothetical protein